MTLKYVHHEYSVKEGKRRGERLIWRRVGVKNKEVDLVEVNPLACVFVMTGLGFLTYLQRGCSRMSSALFPELD